MNGPQGLESSDSPHDRLQELERSCFVIMPFGKKKVGEREIDFDEIYEKVFKPAIEEVSTPEKERLTATRTDKDAFSGAITQDMFEYIMYSRLALGDISGFNANVLYEIGVRHALQESGTVLFRQTGHDIPFDINTIKVFEYAHEPTKIEETRNFMTNVIAETLKRNRLDSPVRLALRAQWGGPSPGGAARETRETDHDEQQPGPAPAEPRHSSTAWRKKIVEDFMRDAQEAIRLGDRDVALTLYLGALRFDRTNIIARMRLGILLKEQDQLHEALEEFTTITKLQPDYGEAWKEKGVVQGRIARKLPKGLRTKSPLIPDGFDALTRATKLVPDDYDAWSSLGGVLKNVREDKSAARRMYAHAAEISGGHPYPLLNALKLEAGETGKLDLDSVREQLLEAEKIRRGQAAASPPVDAPWCNFDLAEIHLYRGDPEGFLNELRRGIEHATSVGDIQSCRDTLVSTLKAANVDLDGLDDGINLLDAAITSRTNKSS